MRVCEGQGVEMCNGHELATTHPSRVVDGVAVGRRISCAACAGATWQRMVFCSKAAVLVTYLLDGLHARD